MIIKKGEEAAYKEEQNVACPICGHEYTHIIDVTVYKRDGGEDGLSYALKPGSPEKDYTAGIRNPSPRRHAVSLHFSGECGHNWITDLSQHKGITLLSVIELKSDK